MLNFVLTQEVSILWIVHQNAMFSIEPKDYRFCVKAGQYKNLFPLSLVNV
jgi:hypothetical protein